MTVKAYINPEMILWGRERHDLSLEDFAARIKVKPDKLEQWERGQEYPSFPKAQDIASILRIPLGYLYLAHPPDKRLPISDFRMIGDFAQTALSDDFYDVLDDALRKQDWYRDYLKANGFESLPFIASFTMASPPESVAVDICSALAINDSARQRAFSWKDFLRILVANAEENRILVMRNSLVGNNSHRPLSVAEFRGFALSDAMAPLVFINSRDAKAAQIFTLVHEIAHLWLGKSGVSNPDLRHETSTDQASIERYCNLVAAEILLPGAQFLADWNPREDLDTGIARLVRKYRVSSIVALRRALDLNLIRREIFFRQYDIEIRKQQPVKRGEERGDPYATNWTRNSKRLTTALVHSVFEGQTLYRDAARLLGVRVKTLRGLADRLEVR